MRVEKEVPRAGLLKAALAGKITISVPTKSGVAQCARDSAACL